MWAMMWKHGELRIKRISSLVSFYGIRVSLFIGSSPLFFSFQVLLYRFLLRIPRADPPLGLTSNLALRRVLNERETPPPIVASGLVSWAEAGKLFTM